VRNGIPRAVALELPRPFNKKVDFEFMGFVGMVAAVPGKPVPAGKPVHKNRILNLHAYSVAE
jgi:hypothetical protein